jgi:site-specific recombinase XerD
VRRAPTVERESCFVDLEDRFLWEVIARSPETRRNYKTALGVFKPFLAETRSAAWETAGPSVLDVEVLKDFYLWLVDGYGRDQLGTVATYTVGATAFLRFLARTGRLPGDVSLEQMREQLRAVRQKAPYRSPRIDGRLPLLVEHVMSIPLPSASDRKGLKLLEVLRDKALILLLYSSGIRRLEASRANRTDCDDGRADRLIVFGKGDKERVAFLDQETQTAIRAYLTARNDTHRPLFLRHDNRRGAPGRLGERWRLDPASIWRVVKHHAQAAGVPASTHHLRHLKASTLLNRGAAIDQVQDLLGHASPETTKRVYAHYTTERLREVFDRFSQSPQEAAAEARRRYAGRREIEAEE